MAAKTTRSRYRIITITTFAILFLGFLYYYFGYVKAREKQFDKKAFDHVERLGKNIEKRIYNYQQVLKNSIEQIINFGVGEDINPLENARVTELNRHLHDLGTPRDFDVKLSLDISLNEALELGIIDSKDVFNLLKQVYSLTLLQYTNDVAMFELKYIDSNNKVWLHIIELSLQNVIRNTLHSAFFDDFVIFSESFGNDKEKYNKILDSFILELFDLEPKNQENLADLRMQLNQQELGGSRTNILYKTINTPSDIGYSLDSIFFTEKPGYFSRKGKQLTNFFRTTDQLEVEYRNQRNLVYVTPITHLEKTIFVGGLVEAEKRKNYGYQLGSNTLIVVIISLILFVFSFPFIKLFLISENERLGRMDGIISAAVIILGTAFLTACYFLFLSHKSVNKNVKIDRLKHFAGIIEDRFSGELEMNLRLIDCAENKLEDINARSKDPNERFLPEKKFFSFDLKVSEQFKAARIIPRAVFWTNKDGWQLVSWSANPSASVRVNIKGKRDYFDFANDTTKKKLWYAKRAPEGFYLQSLESNTNARHYTVISKPSRLKKSLNFREDGGFFYNHILRKKPEKYGIPSTVSLTTNLKSLSNLPVPPDLQFMVINRAGDVLYHKDSTKRLQENFFEDLYPSAALEEVIYSKGDDEFKAFYNQHLYRFYVKELSGFPIYLVVFSDEKIALQYDAQAFGLTISLYFLLLAALALLVLLNELVYYPFGIKLNRKHNYFLWIQPNINNYRRFIFLLGFLIFAGVLFLAFVSSVFKNVLFTYSYALLLFGSVLYILGGEKRNDVKSFKLKKIVFYSFTILAALILFINSEANPVYGLLHLAIIGFALTGRLFFDKSARDDKRRKRDISSSAFNILYPATLLMILTVIIILPGMGFFLRSIEFESDLFRRHTDLGQAREILNWDYVKENCNEKQLDLIYKGENESYHLYQKEYVPGHEPEDPPISGKELSFIRALRLNLSDEDMLSGVLYDSEFDEHGDYNWTHIQDSRVCFNYSFDYPVRKNDNIDYKTLVQQYIYPGHEKSLAKLFHFSKGGDATHTALSILVLVLFLTLLYFLIDFWSKRLFLLGLISEAKVILDKSLLSSRFAYVVTPPYSGAGKMVRSLLEKKDSLKIDLRYSDISEPDKKLDIFGMSGGLIKYDDDGSLVVNPSYLHTFPAHFIIHDFTSVNQNSVKFMSELINLIKKEHKKIDNLIILSHNLPSELMEEAKNSHWQNGDALNQFRIDVNNYLEILGDFNLKYYPIQQIETTDRRKTELNFLNEKDRDRIAAEIKKLDLNESDEVIHIQNEYKLYYFSIWNSLEKREKFIIYDLAQDGLVNSKNIEVVNNLLRRGILIRNRNRIELFNRSFENFVLTIIDRKESLEYELEAKKSGNWSNLRYPLLLVIAAAFLFLFITQQDLFKDVIGWITALVAAVPVLTRLLVGISAFRFGKEKVESAGN